MSLENLRSRIESFLKETPFQVTKDGSYSLLYGSTNVVIKPLIFSGTIPLVSIFAYVVQGVNVNDKLMRYLNDINSRIVFGRFFVIEEEKLVVCQHSLFGSTLGKDELFTAIAAVAGASNQYDEEIMQKFGGKRFIDVFLSRFG